jgi:hypothetical protein
MLGMPFMPISVPLLQEQSFFYSNNANVVRAGLFLLEAAWRSESPGSISAERHVLLSVTRLSDAELDACMGELMAGWKIDVETGRMRHPGMEKIALSIQERFGDEIGVIADSAIAAIQGGDSVFEFASPKAIAKRKVKGKTALPANFEMDATTSQKATDVGYVSEAAVKWLLSRFADYARSGDVRQKDWQATLRLFMSNTITRKEYQATFGSYLGATTLPAPLSASGFDSTGFNSSNIDIGGANTAFSNPHSGVNALRQALGKRPPATFAQLAGAANSDVMQRAMQGVQIAAASNSNPSPAP